MMDIKRKRRNRTGNMLLGYILTVVMVSSLILPGFSRGGIVQAKDTGARTLVIGDTSRCLIAKSQNGVIYTYRSSNTNIASVSGNGVITGRKKGRVSVIRYVTRKHKTRIDRVQIFRVVPFSISGKKTIYVNGSYSYKTQGNSVKWKSSSTKKASISKKGKLKAKQQGTVTITAKYKNQTAKKKILIKKDKMDHIEVAYKGNSAYMGNPVSKGDFLVKAVYKSGKKKTVSNYTFSKNAFSREGKESITVTYGKYKAKATVNVLPKEVTSLQVTYQGGPLAVGQSVNPNDLKVTAVYNDGSTRILAAEEFALGNATAKEKGTLAVVVTHIASGVQETVNISANALAIMGVDANYSGGVIYKEEGVDTAKVKLVVTYEDGSTALVDASDIRVGSTTSEDGKVKILLYYTVDGVEYSTVLSVQEKSHKLTELLVESERAYAFCKKELNRDNFVVKAKYSDGEERIVGDWICDFQVMDQAGEQTVTFQYTEDDITVSHQLIISVKESRPLELKVTKPISQVTEGDSLDLSQMEVILIYEDGLSEVISGYQTDYNSSDRTIGERNVTVSYEGFTTTMKLLVEARTVISISATDPSGVTLAGSALNTTGIAVTAFYDNGTSEIVNGWTTSYSSALPAGVHAITVTYGGVSCSIHVSVENPLTVSISASSVIVKHAVTVTCNQKDVEYSVVGGNAALCRNGETAVTVTGNEPGTITVQLVRSKTGEVRQVAFTAVAFKLSYVNTAGGNAAEGDRLVFSTNASAQFRYRVEGTDGNVYTGSSSAGVLSYNYTANKLGVLTVTATDLVSGVVLEKTVTVRKALAISGSSSVTVGKSITLTTTKQVVSWSSSNKAVATVSQSGVVKGVKAGTVRITATFPEYGNRTVTKTITVKKAS